MGRRGPAPTPTRLKVLRGTATPRAEEPEPAAGVPIAPGDTAEAARDEWQPLAWTR